MRYLTTIVWAALLGQVVGFLVSALSGLTYDPKMSLVASVIFGILLLALPPMMEKYAIPSSNRK